MNDLKMFPLTFKEPMGLESPPKFIDFEIDAKVFTFQTIADSNGFCRVNVILRQKCYRVTSLHKVNHLEILIKRLIIYAAKILCRNKQRLTTK